jgi:hypothetical protein
MSFEFLAPFRNNPTEMGGVVTTAQVTDQQGNVKRMAVYVSQEIVDEHGGPPYNAEDIARHKFETGQLDEDERGNKIIAIGRSDLKW